MPELPEVETTVRGLRPVLMGQRLARVEPRRADLRRAIPPDLRQRMTGATVTALGRRAKYGLIDTDRGDTLIFHLGMSGRWRVDPAELLPHDHLLIETDDGRTLALHDPRRFGSLDLLRTEAIEDFAAFRALGPEPLGPDLTPDYLVGKLAGRIAPIKLLLLDQRIVAGLGNIYVCEALNVARIDPRAPGGSLTKARLGRLVPAIRSVLESAIEAGGSTLRDYARPDGELGYFSKQFRVYGREGEPCPCGRGVVLRQVDGGRSTFWCPACQK
ncbi:bifunctional DNA-formamidopyrimidine glycosylase/DNA-(apurinic or apyrimidinic site) lyase [Sphingomonas nostoxanthinifaciens]|uniref:bifunctional DNA-formamidopyrimidine glycosylase/DNA-(apurinic or apyrimidinic site) lyase n=1 Tax=Sphingomonas nostoxanthinifaciens TaxID=2872652 RepID=UPI001CC1EF92|nr:bifunctional DNA-formamidopyrimidine glycosylase/DNA-(apurinic or apyrimidinic site) lyase [Sphingomonas nostoxanthinifaciens]UAK22819.1 bifunctional DNA-formamidopyrimidine glycosylase/DNA-(apurinic or apyrimidinic site) lyase [Sphingomonas nostoxanthinifaciens]